MRKLLLAAAASFVIATPALADGDATAQPASLVQPVAVQKQVVCRVMTHEGMVLRKPLCMTRAQWDLAGYKARQELADFQVGRHRY